MNLVCGLQYLDDLHDKPGHRLQAHLGNVVTQGIREVLVVGFRQDHPGKEVSGDPLKQRKIMGQKLGQVDIIDGPQQEHTLVLLWVLEFQVPCSSKDRLDGPHAIVVVVLGGKLLRTQPVGGDYLGRQVASIHKSHGIERDLSNKPIIRDHHCHCTKQNLQK